jgi:aldehyde dehydrogenase (NAD+)
LKGRSLNPTAEVMDIIRPTDGQVIARVTLADEEDTRRAIAAAKHTTYGRRRGKNARRFCANCTRAASPRLNDLTAAVVEEYGRVVQFAGLIVQSGVGAFLMA